MSEKETYRLLVLFHRVVCCCFCCCLLFETKYQEVVRYTFLLYSAVTNNQLRLAGKAFEGGVNLGRTMLPRARLWLLVSPAAASPDAFTYFSLSFFPPPSSVSLTPSPPPSLPSLPSLP